MEAPPLERKLVAILAADVEGYSRLMGADEEGTLVTLSSHRAIADALIARHGGRICGTAGDSVLAEFASVFSAVHCAVEIQQALAQANQALEDNRRMWFRIGINVGDVMVKDGDIFGDGVNITARLQGLADPGGICVSRGVRDHVVRKLRHDFEDLGEQSVKNIVQPIRAYRLRAGTAPPEESTEQVMASGSPRMLQNARSSDEPEGNGAAEQSIQVVFWESIKDSVQSADYEAYLSQYPEGAFVELARTRLRELADGIAPKRDPQEREIELSFWESVRDSDNLASLRAYLDKYPDGEFKALAQIQLEELGARRR
jgi:class 3 adenylate cyclase